MRHRTFIWTVVGILALVTAAVWILRWNGMLGVDENKPVESRAPEITREALKEPVAVPEVGSKVASDNMAVPTLTGPAGPNTKAQYRSFTLVAMGNTFAPNMIAVRAGDVVNIHIRAADQDYDFVQPDYGFNMPIPKGQTKVIEFNATAPGAFTFYCSRCNTNKAEGSIIINNE